MACIAGAVTETFYGGVPQELAEDALFRLPEPLLEIVQELTSRYCAR